MGSLLNNFPTQIFRAYDIRGKSSLLTSDMVRAIAHGLAQQYARAGQKQLAIGYDARLSSPQYAAIIHSVCAEYDIESVIIGCCSSPMLYYVARDFGGNGIMVTASHNPKSDNGIKWILQAEPPAPEMIQQVAADAKSHFVPVSTMQHKDTQHQIFPIYCLQYQHALLADIQLNKRFKVVLDGMHGSAGRCANLVLNKLGCEVKALRCTANGEFPDHAPDPSQEAHLTQIRKFVLEQQADLGIALDGDGDRLVMIDEQGKIITADRLLCLFAEMCLSEHPQREVVYDVKCSTMLRKTVEALNGRATMLRTGSTFLRKYLAHSQGKAVFGGEYAGHYVFNDGRGWGYDDGLYAALRIMEYLQQKNMTLSQALEAYPERLGTEDIYISTHHTDPKTVLAEVERQSAYLNAEISKIDGIRLDFDDGFGIIRASNTGEYFTLRFDADTASRLAEIHSLFVNMIAEQFPLIAQDISDAY
ncbi:phosphomannomutase/phosphoglucomutase [Acinetobacter tianfuensis]|uniref:phosphomannomutase n=1 Tax=Acinetobacter tianfuensis TaxID=2419603 RepID=A0A3A8E7K3_9GAMM|nr:phosphomannomutase/phosphoglucomutase [Acinetobacter tianfuensis]RKG30159.1 phosphomannomutase/phosphoglucomutase [Acinetobacter tianfuensis]